jgi:hypothetical protein
MKAPEALAEEENMTCEVWLAVLGTAIKNTTFGSSESVVDLSRRWLKWTNWKSWKNMVCSQCTMTMVKGRLLSNKCPKEGDQIYT